MMILYNDVRNGWTEQSNPPPSPLQKKNVKQYSEVDLQHLLFVLFCNDLVLLIFHPLYVPFIVCSIAFSQNLLIPLASAMNLRPSVN